MKAFQASPDAGTEVPTGDGTTRCSVLPAQDEADRMTRQPCRALRKGGAWSTRAQPFQPSVAACQRVALRKVQSPCRLDRRRTMCPVWGCRTDQAFESPFRRTVEG